MKKMNVNKVETEKNNTTKQKIKFLSLASKDKRSEEEPKQQLIMKKNVYSYSCSPAPSRSELPVSEFTSSQPPSQTLPPSEPSEPPASQLLTPEKASTRHFIDSLPGNTVFFCCACWHYVFTI